MPIPPDITLSVRPSTDDLGADVARKSGSGEIGVREVPLVEIERVDLYRLNERLVLMIDGCAYALRRGAATELAFNMCSQLEAMER